MCDKKSTMNENLPQILDIDSKEHAELQEGCRVINLGLTDSQVAQLLKFLSLLRFYNQQMDLTAVKDSDMVGRHLLDSLEISRYPEFTGSKRIIDIGSGAGLPGIPLAIAYPDKEFLLLDARQKRIGFLNTCIEEMGLKNVVAAHGRVEDLGHGRERAKFDAAISRAFAELRIVLECSAPLLKVGGQLLALKGEHARDEIVAAGKAGDKLGFSSLNLVPREGSFLPSGAAIVLAKKIKATPNLYPRPWKKMGPI